MYRILLFLCILETMAFDSDEAKYIDLLPEAEKQEFLNRIARRILEEIQSKDSPEESHAEVTDDQLDAHETYVQEILKEESDNLRNEKREISQMSKDVIEPDGNPNEDKEEKTHIDLTFREGQLKTERRLNENSNFNDNPDTINDTPYSVIPVKVVYDKDKVIQDESTTHTSLDYTNDGEQSAETVAKNFDQQLNNSESNEKKSNTKEYNPYSVEDIRRPDQSNKESPAERDKSKILPNTEREYAVEISSTTINQDIVHKDDNNFQIPEEQSIASKNDKESSTKVDIENEKGSDDVTNIISITVNSSENRKSNESLKDNETSTTNDRYQNNSHKESNIKESNDYSIFIPLTTELNMLSDSNNVKNTEKYEETTAIKGLTMNPNTKYHNKINANLEGNESSKKHYRKKLKILSEDYSAEEAESFESNDRQNEDNADDRYFVYEISDDKPAYIRKAVTKDHEQPYYIPIYNFAPNNAYYNAYNHLGPNAKEEFEILPDDNSDELDEKLYRSNSFLIELRSKGDKKTRYNYPKEKIRPDPREYNSRFVPNLDEARYNYYPYVDTDYYYYPQKARRQSQGFKEDNRWGLYAAGQQSLDSDVRDLPDFTMDKNIEKLVYGSRRRGGKERKKHKKKKLSVRELPNSSEEDHPYYSIHKSNIKDHVRAVRKLLYKQKKFGFMPPSPYAIKTEPRYKRMMVNNEVSAVTDKKDLSRDNLMEQSNTNSKNIAWDYYWGRLKYINTTNDFDDLDDEEVSKKLPNARRERGFKTGNSNVSIDTLTDVLKDMIRRDSRYLVSYNWLQTTVEVVGAIKKLLDLTENVQNGHHIHPLDLDLLNYVINFYISSKYLLVNSLPLKTKSQHSKVQSDHNIDVSKTIKCLLARTRTLPKTKKRKLGEKIKNPINLWNAWNQYYNRVLNEDNDPNTNLLSEFKDFLLDLQDNLYELHNALKRIALITTYKKQIWYQDLKSIFLKAAPRRRLQQVLLHLGTSKLVDSIENSMKKRNADNSVKNNKEDTRKIQEYFVFVLEVLEVINGEITNQFTNDFLRECRR